MKAMRLRRKQALIRAGFTPIEAQIFSEFKKPTPYFTRLVASRRGLRAQATRLGWSEAQYQRYIKNLYAKDKILRPETSKRAGQIDPWALFRRYEDHFKGLNPEYDTPGVKKPNHSRDFNYTALEQGPKRSHHKRERRKDSGKPYG